MNQEQRKPFKDYFDQQTAQIIAERVTAVYSRFDQDTFIQRCCHQLNTLEFQDRIKQFAAALRQGLPKGYPAAAKVLVRSLPTPLERCEGFTDHFHLWPYGQLIAEHGLPHFAESFAAMTALTQCFSAEFAVRPFVESLPERTFQQLQPLTQHENAHVRRWCSEGTRPRLPWGRKLHALIDDPSPIFPLLDPLVDDPELYVRRSVANNLNDIAKDHPDLVVDWVAQRYDADQPQRVTLATQALRTLIKDGHPGALKLLGYRPGGKLDTKLKVTPKRVAIGESVKMQAAITNLERSARRLMIDYVVDYVRQGGKIGRKVFKWKTLELATGQACKIEKQHPMKITTVRRLYPGKHTVGLQINGEVVQQTTFQLTESP